MQLTLTIVNDEGIEPWALRHTFDVNGGTIGRSEQCDWFIPDFTNVMSSYHAQISHNGKGFLITDNSTNGVYLNSTDVPLGRGQASPITNGDVIYIAHFVIKVEISNRSSLEFEYANPPQDWQEQGSNYGRDSNDGRNTQHFGGMQNNNQVLRKAYYQETNNSSWMDPRFDINQANLPDFDKLNSSLDQNQSFGSSRNQYQQREANLSYDPRMGSYPDSSRFTPSSPPQPIQQQPVHNYVHAEGYRGYGDMPPQQGRVPYASHAEYPSANSEPHFAYATTPVPAPPNSYSPPPSTVSADIMDLFWSGLGLRRGDITSISPENVLRACARGLRSAIGVLKLLSTPSGGTVGVASLKSAGDSRNDIMAALSRGDFGLDMMIMDLAEKTRRQQDEAVADWNDILSAVLDELEPESILAMCQNTRGGEQALKAEAWDRMSERFSLFANVLGRKRAEMRASMQNLPDKLVADSGKDTHISSQLTPFGMEKNLVTNNNIDHHIANVPPFTVPMEPLAHLQSAPVIPDDFSLVSDHV